MPTWVDKSFFLHRLIDNAICAYKQYTQYRKSNATDACCIMEYFCSAPSCSGVLAKTASDIFFLSVSMIWYSINEFVCKVEFNCDDFKVDIIVFFYEFNHLILHYTSLKMTGFRVNETTRIAFSNDYFKETKLTK